MTPLSKILRQKAYDLIGFRHVNRIQRQTDFKVTDTLNIIVNSWCRHWLNQIRELQNLGTSDGLLKRLLRGSFSMRLGDFCGANNVLDVRDIKDISAMFNGSVIRYTVHNVI